MGAYNSVLRVTVSLSNTALLGWDTIQYNRAQNNFLISSSELNSPAKPVKAGDAKYVIILTDGQLFVSRAS